MTKILSSIAAAACLAIASPAMAAVVVGGYTFNDNAFADSLIGSSGSYTTSGSALASVLTDLDPGTYAFSSTRGAYVQLGFTDNTLVNGTGADLVLFELGAPSVFGLSLTINGVSHTYASQATGGVAGGFSLNAAAIDLSDFGLADGVSLSSIVVRMDDGTNTYPSLSLVGALNSGSANTVPEPATFGLAGLALLGVGVARRRRAG